MSRKISMELEAARKLGREMAAAGWTEPQVGEWLVEAGYAVNGLTAQRIARGYHAQTQNG